MNILAWLKRTRRTKATEKTARNEPAKLQRACRHCHFFQVTDLGPDGECRFHTPNDDQDIPRWPPVKADEWCGQYEEAHE